MALKIYVIKSEATGKIYIGQTSDLTERLKRHNHLLPIKKKGFTSKNRGPWKLVYCEDYPDRSSALAREKFLKSGRGREFLKTILE